MIIYADGRHLQKDKHHCNAPSIWALRRCGQTQPSLQCRHMKTHLELAKKHLNDPQTVRNNIIWSNETQFQASKYRDSLNENPIQSIQHLRLGRRFTFQQDNEPKHTARVAYTQLCECPWVAQSQPELEPNQIYLEKPENVRLPHPTFSEKNDRWLPNAEAQSFSHHTKKDSRLLWCFSWVMR